jgi:chitosanase
VVGALLAVLVVGCKGNAGPPWPAATTGPSTVTLTADQRRVADELVSVFESSSTTPRYDPVTDLDDGRGYTCGKIGFTTSTTEVRDVVEEYLRRAPESPLARHLPRLRELAASRSDDTTGLDRFPEDWAHAASDQAFREVQDAVADRLTFAPASEAARRAGVRTALGVAVLYDTAVQHGTGDDPDGLPALLGRAKDAAGGEPATGVPEQRWLTVFLDTRADDLRHPHNRETQAAWGESVDRVTALRRLVHDGKHRLAPPVEVAVFGDEYVLR